MGVQVVIRSILKFFPCWILLNTLHQTVLPRNRLDPARESKTILVWMGSNRTPSPSRTAEGVKLQMFNLLYTYRSLECMINSPWWLDFPLKFHYPTLTSLQARPHLIIIRKSFEKIILTLVVVEILAQKLFIYINAYFCDILTNFSSLFFVINSCGQDMIFHSWNMSI